MRTACKLGAAAGAALVTAVVFAAAGCGSLDRSVTRDHCATSSDCNPGRVCVAGICEAPTDGAADIAVDATAQDGSSRMEGGVEAGRDLPPAVEAGPDSPDTQRAEAGVDPSDGPVDGTFDTGAADAPAEALVSLDAARDNGVAPPPDPCATGPGQESPASTPALLAALTGLWRQCPTSAGANVDPDVSWLVGSTHLVQLDPRHWWRCTDGEPPSCGAMAQGLYFRVLEGSNSVFHFADWVEPLNGGGADISIHYYAGSKLLQLEACDGASRCSNNATNLVFVGPVPKS